MKKIILAIIISSLMVIGCSDDNPASGTLYRTVTYKLTGSPNDVLITIIGASGVTQYSHVDLPFDLHPFKVKNGDPIGFNALDWNNSDSVMIGEIVVDGNVYKSVSAAGLLELYGNAP